MEVIIHVMYMTEEGMHLVYPFMDHSIMVEATVDTSSWLDDKVEANIEKNPDCEEEYKVKFIPTKRNTYSIEIQIKEKNVIHLRKEKNRLS